MTENEAKREMTFEEEYKILQSETGKLFADEDSDCETPFANCVVRRALRCIRKLFKEIQAYRAIGTVEELKALKEKSVAKKAGFDDEEGMYFCPNCEKFIGEHQNYCWNCGQAFEC